MSSIRSALNNFIEMHEGGDFKWTAEEMLTYWRDDAYKADGLEFKDAVFDLRQIANILLGREEKR